MSNKLLFKVMEYLKIFRDESLLRMYLIRGRKPWKLGYLIYRDKFINQVITNPDLGSAFKTNSALPINYGIRLDERVIEYPWILSRLSSGCTWLLDAGAALNHPYLISSPRLASKKIFIYTLEPEGKIVNSPNVSYVYGDLRDTLFKDGLFDEIVCISTLEHVGMDNKIYSSDPSFQENKPRDFFKVLNEFSRILRPNGKLLITVPFGKYENHGWLQQFDIHLVKELISSFDGALINFSVYKYEASGWKLSNAEECSECNYFDIHADPNYGIDFAAAARAVACLEMIRTN